MSVHTGWNQRAFIFSMKLSKANPGSTWMGERLTGPGIVDFSDTCFVSFFCTCSVSFSLHFIIIEKSKTNHTEYDVP